MELNGSEICGNALHGSFGTQVKGASTQFEELCINREEAVELSQHIFMFPTKTVGERGNVYEGEVRSLVYGARPCVVKFAELSEQNTREAEILTKLGSHTNVIAIIQSGTYCGALDERVYIALDKCHNENLRQYIANRKAAGIEFDLNQAIDFAKQIIVGVMYIHDNNVIHLDLKPSNILISQNLRLIKLADFGLSIVVKSTKSKIIHKRQFGTNGYRPIESFGNCEVSIRTDIFSLGTVLLHFLSNGNDVFGRDEHAFIHNVMNDITDTSGLLVPNPNTTEHLIKCMASKERCRRPNIWEVSDHPCWSGKETKCQFEYFADDEICETTDDDEKEDMTSLSDNGRGEQFVQKMREMGFNRKPSIIVFDGYNSNHLHRFDHRNNSMTKMHETPDVFHYPLSPRAVSLGEHIYVFDNGRDPSLYKLEYGDVTATWTKTPINIPITNIAVAASLDAIFVHGFWDSGENESPSENLSTHVFYKYHPLLDEWERLKDKPTTVLFPVLICCKGFLYCFGGNTEMGSQTNNVERMNLATTEWSQLSNMIEPRWRASASEFDGKIYLLGGFNRGYQFLNSVEMYNPELDQWTTMKSMLEHRLDFGSFWIEGNLFVVGGLLGPGDIERYDPAKDEWTIVARFPEMRSCHSVLVSLST